MPVTPQSSRERIRAALQQYLPGLPAGPLYYAHGLAVPEPGCMLKSSDYFRIVLTGQYALHFGVGNAKQTRTLAAGDMLLNLRGSWHLETRTDTYLIFAATSLPEGSIYHLKHCPRPGDEELTHYQNAEAFSPLARHLLEALRLAAGAAGIVQASLGRALAWQLLEDLAAAKPALARSRAQFTWECMQQFILENDVATIDRDLLARRFKLHPSHVSRLVKRHSGQNLTRFLTELRMQKAALLLRQADLKAYEIGQLCGYPDPIHFSKAFRTVHDCAPGAYRARHA